MNGLRTRLRYAQKERQDAARLGCELVDWLREAITPSRLDDVQNGLRMGLLEIEARIRAWDDRARPDGRPKRLKRFRARYGATPKIGEHVRIAAEIGAEFRRIRSILRQIGDACAWLVLRQDPRIIRPLYAERTHHLTVGRGLTVPVQLILDAHRIGRFLVLDNDLTRCLGDGDITVVRANGKWRVPLSYELKAPGEDRELMEGDRVTINCTAALSDQPDQVELHNEFTETMGFGEGHLGVDSANLERQSASMLRRARVLIAAAQPGVRLDRDEPHWKAVRSIIPKAQQYGYSFDEPEPGVVYAAVSAAAASDAPPMLDRILQRLQNHIPAGSPILTSADLADHDELAPLALPVALWPAPLPARAAILSGDVLYACVLHVDVWSNTFQSVGLSMTEVEKGWDLTGHGVTLRLDAIEVAKLRLAVAFNGVSPRHVAIACAEEARATAAAELPPEEE